MEWKNQNQSVGCSRCVEKSDKFVPLKRIELSSEGPFERITACPKCGKVYDLFVAPEIEGQVDPADLGLDSDAEIL